MACPGAACHYLAELPGVSGMDPGTPLWHGYLFATRSDWRSLCAVDSVRCRGAAGSSAVSGPLPAIQGTREGVRTQGSPMYSIRATWVDRRAAQLLGRYGS
ncbi:hypothetical protein GCM10010299_65110 [Streptomyces tanashiensis]|nr:hypothetical protein GCM10010299_65110 [Streptomyces tanashiensis]